MAGDEKDGGQAFPRAGSSQGSPKEGMTLRDYFAGQALAGLAKTAAEGISKIKHEKGVDEAGIIRYGLGFSCYRLADAMLKAKEAK